MRARVIDNARELGLDLTDVRKLPGATASPADAAAVVGCGQAQIASCAVYVADGEPVVCISSGSCPVDEDVLADVLDVAELRPAAASEVRAATGFPAGGVPPFGHGLPVVIDEALLDQPTVWAAGGDGYTVVELEPRRLVHCTSATIAAVTALPA
jgi:prolyl-tRNA editing enzyme YbaK/EbsC (Cys-tRNA(Pro) deacylase)